jgi:ubiquinone/menaquinone biosynthesis C-methylase UbiE
MGGIISAHFFQWLQSQRFYSDLHRTAAEKIRQTGVWYDIGTGAGVLAGISAARGFASSGFDINPVSITLARKGFPAATFEVAALSEILATRRGTANVVSMSSLLFVLEDKQAALDQAWALLREEGEMLVIETTEKMTFRNAVGYCLKTRQLLPGLLLWGYVRNGKSVVSDIASWGRGGNIREYETLDGMVKILVFSER